MTQLAHRIDVRSIGRVRVITLDRAALERLAGPLSPGLARFLRAGPAPASVPAPAQTPDHPAAPPPPCREEG